MKIYVVTQRINDVYNKILLSTLDINKALNIYENNLSVIVEVWENDTRLDEWN